MKKIILMLMSILVLALACLTTAYASNEANIKKFNEGVYQKNLFAMFGFTQPYVEHYNNGNMHYKEGDFELAIEEYDKALSLRIPHSHYNDKDYCNECKVRINKALAILAGIDESKITDANVSEILAILQEAKDVLTEKECAIDENSGHNDDAVQLYKEITAFENALKNGSGSSDEGNSNGDETDNKDEKTDDRNSKTQEQELLDNQQQGIMERNRQLEEDLEMDNRDYSYYDGIRW